MTNRFVGLLMAVILVFSVVMLASARGPGKQNGIVVAAAQNSPTMATAPVATVATNDHNNFDLNLIAIAGYAPETVGVVTTTGRRLSTTGFLQSQFAGNYDTNQCNASDIGVHAYSQPRRGVLRT